MLSSLAIKSIIRHLKKNGSSYIFQGNTDFTANYVRQNVITNSAVVDMNGSSDYIEAFAYIDVTSGTPRVESQQASMHIFKMTE